MSGITIAQTIVKVVIDGTDDQQTVSIIREGPPGPRGERGPGGGERYEHVQASAAVVWTINHNLGATPVAVTVLSPGGVEVVAEVRHPSVNQCTIHFAAPQAGRAVIL